MMSNEDILPPAKILREITATLDKVTPRDLALMQVRLNQLKLTGDDREDEKIFYAALPYHLRTLIKLSRELDSSLNNTAFDKEASKRYGKKYEELTETQRNELLHSGKVATPEIDAVFAEAKGRYEFSEKQANTMKLLCITLMELTTNIKGANKNVLPKNVADPSTGIITVVGRLENRLKVKKSPEELKLKNEGTNTPLEQESKRLSAELKQKVIEYNLKIKSLAENPPEAAKLKEEKEKYQREMTQKITDINNKNTEETNKIRDLVRQQEQKKEKSFEASKRTVLQLTDPIADKNSIMTLLHEIKKSNHSSFTPGGIKEMLDALKNNSCSLTELAIIASERIRQPGKDRSEFLQEFYRQMSKDPKQTTVESVKSAYMDFLNIKTVVGDLSKNAALKSTMDKLSKILDDPRPTIENKKILMQKCLKSENINAELKRELSSYLSKPVKIDRENCGDFRNISTALYDLSTVQTQKTPIGKR